MCSWLQCNVQLVGYHTSLCRCCWDVACCVSIPSAPLSRFLVRLPPPPTPRPTGPSSPLSRLLATLQPLNGGRGLRVGGVCPPATPNYPSSSGEGGIGRKLLQDGCPPSPLKRGDSLISPPVTLFWCFGRPWGEVVFRIDFFKKKR